MGYIDVQAAYERIRSHSVCRPTPIINSEAIDGILSISVGRTMKVSFKCEHLQPVGSFKIRGALNFALSLPENVLTRGLVTHSSGNHGIAVAFVGRHLKVPVSVVVPKSISREKLEKIQLFGATVHYCEPTLVDRKAECARIAKLNGMTEVPPFDHEWIIAGQGTQAIEILSEIPDVDAIAVAVGGGGLISGVISAAKKLKPSIKVFGVEPENADDASASLANGLVCGPTRDGAQTICDALAVFPVGGNCWPIFSSGCDGVFTVSDEDVVSAMKLCLSGLNQMVEPSGACALAGLLSPRFIEELRSREDIRHIAIVLCGGNIALDNFNRIVFK